ncbi:MAG TPA: hypothetical protein VGC32_20220 [Solirubrobacterales bacterium]
MISRSRAGSVTRKGRGITSVVLAVLALSPLATAQAAGKAHPKAGGPSLKLVGLSVNEQDFTPGTKVTEKQPINACYYIFGEAATPHEMILVALVKADGIPHSAPTSITMVAPWTTQGFGEPIDEETVPFSKALFADGKESVGTIAGGGSKPDEFFRWVDLQGGSLEAGDGTYKVEVSVKVGGHTLETHGSIKIDC